MAQDFDTFTRVEHPNEVVIAVGPEGSGKTRFAGTSPAPLYVIGTEQGHEQVTLAKDFPDKELYHVGLKAKDAPDVPEIWFGAFFGMAEHLLRALRDLEKAEPGTVIIDSASDLLGIAAAHFNYRLQRADKPIPPMLYGQLYPILQEWIGRIRERHNIVMTARVKDKYAKNKKTGKDEKTGEQIIDLWRTGPYMAEHIVWIERENLSGQRFGAVTKGDNEGRTLLSPTWDSVTQGGEDRGVYKRLLRRLSKAYDYFEEQKGEPQERTVPKTADEAKERIKALLEKATNGESKNGDAK